MKNDVRALRRWRRTAWVAPLAIPIAVTVVFAMRQQPQGVLDSFDLRREAALSVELPLALREVSGFAMTGDGRLFAHGDERGVVSQVDARTGAIVKSFSLGTPPLRGDFEGIAIAGERFFLITATGRLFETREAANGAAAQYNSVDTGFGARCELEGMAYNAADQTLIIGCKEPRDPALRGRVTLFRWSVARRAPASPDRISVPLADVIKGLRGKGFSPSAVEREARSGSYVVVAGPQRLVAEITAEGALVSARELSGRTHRQPEAIAFVGNDALLIGDEGGNRRGTLTRYSRAR
ncbi:MAG TPA: hypothetical protein VJ596_08180 [Gemmatimonadaceae bacterium]|nr:hypothetical protein [Gemmatimonadaceae bacterium]